MLLLKRALLSTSKLRFSTWAWFSTAQNRLSTCNVVLKALRGNDNIRIKPAEALQANRQKVRTEAPELSREKLAQAQAELIESGHERKAAVLGLCRELGLRSCWIVIKHYYSTRSVESWILNSAPRAGGESPLRPVLPELSAGCRFPILPWLP
ncbi:MAG: hypothetical protein ACR2PT_20165 [Endozoicomonas sp.]